MQWVSGQIQEEFGSLDVYFWRFVSHIPVTNEWAVMAQVPTNSAASIALSKDLVKRGFKFVGPTIMYSFMQGVGMVNDHLVSCFRHSQVNTCQGDNL